VVAGPSWYDLWKEWEKSGSSTPSDPADIVDLLGDGTDDGLTILKKACRVAWDDPSILDDNSKLIQYTLTAIDWIEKAAEIAILTQTYNLNLSRWPGYCDYLNIRLELPPIQSIVHVKYYDTTDTQQTLSSTLYELWSSRNPPSLLIKAENVPQLSTERSKVIEIQVTAGYTSLPANLKQVIIQLVAFWYQNIEAYGRLPTPQDGAQALMFMSMLDSLRWRVYP
jgi:uncharacterized phiE125 gp8 family phage protein